MPRILAVDPGRKTGYCYWHDGKRTEGERLAATFLKYADDLIENGEVDFVVCERFIITHQTGKYSQAPWSLEQIGALRFLCEKYGVSFVLQNAADAKRFGSEKNLSALGWKRPRGDGHARDAQRHLLLFIAKHKYIGNDELSRILEN